ncbi:MAG: GAF domain-containing protein [Armatimonadota bacterium]|nr:GAF domain-containing protein [Armatimonadota bacterium]
MSEGNDPLDGTQNPLIEAEETIRLQAATIQQQSAEIERLLDRIEANGAADELREALSLAAITGTIGSSVVHSQFLEMIVRTAVHVINATYGTLFLVHEETQDISFEVATAPDAEEVKKMRLPLGFGVVGLVMQTGQGMAISGDPRQKEVRGYKPKNLVCVPLLSNDRIIGALQLLEKKGVYESRGFDQEDIGTLSIFADQAAVAIELSRSQQSLAALVGQMLESSSTMPESQKQRLRQRTAAAVAPVEEDIAFRQALDLARFVQQIVSQGENEVVLCRTILTGFRDYIRLRSDPLHDRSREYE